MNLVNLMVYDKRNPYKFTGPVYNNKLMNFTMVHSPLLDKENNLLNFYFDGLFNADREEMQSYITLNHNFYPPRYKDSHS
jgi:hypothetical protein